MLHVIYVLKAIDSLAIQLLLFSYRMQYLWHDIYLPIRCVLVDTYEFITDFHGYIWTHLIPPDKLTALNNQLSFKVITCTLYYKNKTNKMHVQAVFICFLVNYTS